MSKLIRLILSAFLGLILITTVAICGTDEISDLDYNSYINANQLLTTSSNVGLTAHADGEIFPQGIGGLYYPYTSLDDIISGQTHSLIYSSGLWLGGIVGTDTLVAIAEFTSDFWPGPMTGGTFDPDADTVSAYRVYRLYSDSMALNPNQDYLDWPVGQGAPVNGLGQPVCMGDQMLWVVYNDANPDGNPSRARFSSPLGIEVHQTTWASDMPLDERVVYIEYRLFNKGGNNISDFCLSIWLDPDLGDASDDLVGCDTASDIYYCYNATNDDAYYYGNPPAVGYRMIAGPITASTGDSALFFGKYIDDYKNIRMSSFYKYIGGQDPQSATWAYNYMRGLEQDGTLPPNGSVYQVPGDPVNGTGELDFAAGNRMMLGSFGPIDFNTGDSQYVMIKIGVGQGMDRLTSITDLKYILNAPFDFPVDVEEKIPLNLPAEFTLDQNYPNPFNSSTVISYSLSRKSPVKIEIYNILGEKIAELDQGIKAAGKYRVLWNGHDKDGNSLPTGFYFSRVVTADRSETRKMLLLK
ncbi:MAG: hypothetical protein DRP46_08500 [Candidatus Zixiibacteriota bacterium]|nr:MAG: hypothetical protein DRP46_08500 [candidate division Zixibacteria bacterium]